MNRTLALGLAALLVLPSCRPDAGDGDPPPETGAASSGAPVSPPSTLPSTPAGRLVARSIDFHDPRGAWWSRPIRLRWVSSRPGGERRVASLEIDNAAGAFDVEMELRGHALEMAVTGDSARTLVDGSPDPPPDVRERLRLDREGGVYWRNYFLFLVGLPMKLADAGAELGAEARSTTFQGREVRAVTVRYDPQDRYPWWELYFAPDDARLVGARFWNRGRDADGEYITMEGLSEAGWLRLPRTRRWYTNAADEHLGTDRVEGLSVGGD